MPTTTFTTLSTTAGLPTGTTSSSLNNMASVVASYPAAIGYVSPDRTSIAQTPVTGLGTLAVARLRSPNGTFYLPNYTNISTALSGAQKNPTNLVAPSTAAQAADPTRWLPLLPEPQTGYPIVGYLSGQFATCYQAGKGGAIVAFVTRHLQTNGPYKSIVLARGYIPLTNAAYLAAIKKYFLTPSSTGLDIGDATTCAGRTGR